MTYASIDRVRLLGGLSTTDISDGYLQEIIDYSIATVNADISTKVTLERVDYIDQYRENTIDGSNTTFYTQNSWKWALGDLDNDGCLDTGDIEAWEYKTDDTREQLTVSTINTNGEFTVSTAPAATSDVRITYTFQPVDLTHPLVKDACAYLAASMSYTRISPADYNKVQIGRLKFETKGGDSSGTSSGASGRLLNKYQEIIKKIDYLGFVVARPGVTYLTMDVENTEMI